MQIMKSPTIWESASRPLFVRSVWLETPKIGRAGPQRHFILDYEPRRRSAHSKSAVSSGRNKTYATLQHSNSYDFVGDWRNYNQCGALTEKFPTDLLLIVPAKVESLATIAAPSQSQTQQKQQTAKPQSSTCRAQKHSNLFFRNRPTHHGPLHELYELYSHHSSLQDLQSTLSQANSHADERLAERVLNWLDLAGKRIDSYPPQQLDVQEMVKNREKRKAITAPKVTASAKVTPSQAPRTSSNVTMSNKAQRSANAQATTKLQTQTRSQTPIHSQAHTQTQAQPSAPPQLGLHNRRHVRSESSTVRTEQTATTSQAGQSGQMRPPADAVKHITIIFDREGVPVRFNRPVRNIDLCTLSASPDTVRRLAGSLASARLYNEVERPPGNAAPKTMSSRLRSSSDATSATKSTQKRTHDPSVFDAKKQLHIFMPNLPKKDLLTAVRANSSGCGSVDDTLSGLSNTFSELCKI